MDVSRRDLLITTAATGAVTTLGHELVGSAQAASVGAWSGPAAAPADAGPAPGSEFGTTRVIPGRCHECHPQCPLLVHVRAGRVVKVEGDPKGPNRGALCAKGQATVQNLYHPERLNYPMKRTRQKGELDPGWVRISWDEALDTIVRRLNEIKARYGARSIAVGQGTGRYTEHLISRLKNAIGTPNSIGPNHICRGPMAATVGLTIGHHVKGEYQQSGCQVYWGRNESWAHAGIAGGGIMDNWQDRHSKLIVVDPRFEHPLAHKADVFLPIRPGTDGAMFLSWVHVILSEQLYDKEFVSRWTNGPLLVRLDTGKLLREGDVVEGGDARDFLPSPQSIEDRRARPTLMVWDTASGAVRPVDTPGVEPALFGEFTVKGIRCKPVLQMLAERAAHYAPEKAAEICWSGLAEKIRQAARMYATSPSGCTDVGSFGIQGIEGGHTNAFQTMRAQISMSAITGNINRPGGESGTPHWRWITGEWRRQGGPRSMTPWGAPGDYESVELEGVHSTEPALNQFALQPGLPSMLDCFRAMKTGKPYPIKAYVMIQGNPLGGWCEDQKTVYEGLKALDFLVDMDLYITPTNNLADIVLPAGLGPFERGEKPAIGPMYERWSDERFYVELGHRLNPELWPWRTEAEWREAKEQQRVANIAAARAAGFAAVERGQPAPPLDYYKAIDPKTGKPVGFPTPTGKIEIFSVIAQQNGFDPLPDYREPQDSPYSQPEQAKQYPLVLTTGARVPVYYHSQHRNNPLQRELYPHPQAQIHPETAAKFGVTDGQWIWIETRAGKIRMRAQVTPGILPGVVSMSHGWWQGCRELGLPGYGWEGANANLLIAGDAHDPALGVPSARSSLCRISPAEGAPAAWQAPYHGTTQPAALCGPPEFAARPGTQASADLTRRTGEEA